MVRASRPSTAGIGSTFVTQMWIKQVQKMEEWSEKTTKEKPKLCYQPLPSQGPTGLIHPQWKLWPRLWRYGSQQNHNQHHQHHTDEKSGGKSPCSAPLAAPYSTFCPSDLQIDCFSASSKFLEGQNVAEKTTWNKYHMTEKLWWSRLQPGTTPSQISSLATLGNLVTFFCLEQKFRIPKSFLELWAQQEPLLPSFLISLCQEEAPLSQSWLLVCVCVWILWSKMCWSITCICNSESTNSWRRKLKFSRISEQI